MDKELCVIVGAGPGVSQGVARKFGKEGYKIALVARKAETLAGYTEELKASGIESSSYVGDAGDFASLEAAFTKIKAELGNPAVLVYNVAAMRQGTPSATSPESLIDDLKINVGGALAAANQVIPAMREQNKGTILFTGGGLALNPNPAVASLAVGKAAIRSLAFSLGAELEADNIQVATVTICGYVRPGTHFDPDLIAEAYWTLHTQPAGERQREIQYI
jgi:short-subunit dehydrogenase